MAEIVTELKRLFNGDVLIPEKASHSDILRYIIDDVGKEHALALLNALPDKDVVQ